MIVEMINNKKLDSIVSELFIRGRKLSIYFAFVTQFYFKVPKDVRLNTSVSLNTSQFFFENFSNKREF